MSLEIIIGCMFSGKSTELLKRLLTHAEIGLKCLYINHSNDNRNKNHPFSTHHPFIVPKNYENIEFYSYDTLNNLIKEEYDVIGIDEAQMFDESLIKFVNDHVDIYNKELIVCGLNSDYQRNQIGHILELIPRCNTLCKLNSYCKDCQPKKEIAIFSAKYNRINKTIGGSELYKPVCRKCYLEKYQ